MTGQGFGGCTYTFIREDTVEEFKKRLEEYERIFGFHPVFYEIKIASGCRLISGATREKPEKRRSAVPREHSTGTEGKASGAQKAHSRSALR